MATTVSHRLPPTQAHAIAALTGYEDADTLRWQQACVHAAQQLTGEQGRYASTDPDRLVHGLTLAQRGSVTLSEDLDDLSAEVTSGNAHYTVDLGSAAVRAWIFSSARHPARTCWRPRSTPAHAASARPLGRSSLRTPPRQRRTPACRRRWAPALAPPHGRRSQERPCLGRRVRVARAPCERTVA